MLWIVLCLTVARCYARLLGTCKLSLWSKLIREHYPHKELIVRSIGRFTEDCWTELIINYHRILKEEENDNTLFHVHLKQVSS